MKTALEAIRGAALEQLAAAGDLGALEELRIRYLGKKGELTAILKQMGGLSAQERPVMGQLANQEALESRTAALKAAAAKERLKAETLDVTLPGRQREAGYRHPLSQVLEEIKEIFLGMGFDVVDGPEVETDYYNFEALNIPKNHPARDTQDTFYISDNVVLRTQTSPVQIRTMEQRKPPIRIIAPGRVYRSDEVDATHSPVFHQIEGLVVDKGITMTDLKGCLATVCRRLYGEDTVVRFRPHPLPSRRPSWTCSALPVRARAAACARARAGSSCWAAAWCTPRCWPPAASTPRNTAALPLAWAWSAWSCGATAWTTCGSSMKTICAFCASFK